MTKQFLSVIHCYSPDCNHIYLYSTWEALLDAHEYNADTHYTCLEKDLAFEQAEIFDLRTT